MKRTIKLLVALIIFIILFFIVDLSALSSVLLGLDLFLLLVLIALSFLMVFVSAMKWRLFLSHFGIKVSLFRVNAFYYIGYFVNLALPSYIGGDALRSFLVTGQGKRQFSFAATILERYTGLVAMTLLAVIASIFSPFVPEQFRFSTYLLALAVIGVTIIVWKFPSLFKGTKKETNIIKTVSEVRGAFKEALRSPQLLLESMLLSFLFHALTVANTLLAAYALGWYEVPVQELFILLPFVLLVGALPITPMGLGVQEGAFFAMLQLLGASPEMSLAIPLLLRVKSYSLSVAGAVVFFAMKIDLNYKKDHKIPV